ncbi:MAG TPA: ABC transporter permease [Gemmatimonadaceae bacterium]|nr:ABC transporter permease [Gemmatimonadaceae bacterium]
MPLRDAIVLALSQLRVQKLKSFFTLIGVMIGVMFLIGVVSIVEGMGRYVQEGVGGKLLGVNTFTLRRRPDFTAGNVTEATWREWSRRPRIMREDVEAVAAVLPAEDAWAVDNSDWVDAQSRFARSPQVLAHAASASIFAIKHLDIASGRAYSEQEAKFGKPVVVIGQEVADYYFPGLNPIGRELRFDGLPYRVVGVLEKQGTVFGLPLDRQVFAPDLSPLARLTNPRGDVDGVIVQSPTPAGVQEAQEIVRETMRSRHQLRPGVEDDFALESSESALSAWAKIQRILVIAGMVLPAIGLVVGAIVIMNIMLMAVAQRTREIGIRKALGARRRDILRQFLVEAATLSVLGAIVGIALGVGLAHAIAAVSPLPSSVALWSVLLAIALGAGVGIVAGIYPASRASKLDPVVALRAE